MKLQIKRLEAGLKQSDIVAEVQQVERQFGTKVLSKIENGIVLPTPQELKIICAMLRCDPLDIYDREEIDLINCMDAKTPRIKRKPERRTEHRKITFRLYKDACTSLNIDVLRYCGYQTAQAWFYACIKRLGAEYAARKRDERKKELRGASNG